MKQFICIKGIHYSVDGILLIENMKSKATDILPELVQQMVESIDDDCHPDIASVKFENLNAFILQIIHLGEPDPIKFTLSSVFIRTKDDCDALQQYVVGRIASSNEPILELEDIVTEYYGKPIADTLPKENV
jgi:hypothetical protein